MSESSVIPFKNNIFLISENKEHSEKKIIHSLKKNETLLDNLKANNIHIITDSDDGLGKIQGYFYKYVLNYFINKNKDDVFWYRVLVSIIAGLFIYIFLSVAVPDPIPIFDELAFSIIGGLVIYFLCIKMNLFNINKQFVVDEYIKHIDGTIISKSLILSGLNNFYDECHKKLPEIDDKDDFDIFMKVFNNFFSTYSENDFEILKELILNLSCMYNFKKLKLFNKRYKKELKNSGFIKERFYFYYILFRILFSRV